MFADTELSPGRNGKPQRLVSSSRWDGYGHTLGIRGLDFNGRSHIIFLDMTRADLIKARDFLEKILEVSK